MTRATAHRRDPAEWLRARCRRLDGVTETAAWGHPNFKAGGRTFATFEVVRGRPSIALRLGAELQAVLIDETRWFLTPYSGKQGWVSAWVDGPADWRILERFVRQAHALALGSAKPAPAKRAARAAATNGRARRPTRRPARWPRAGRS